VITNEQHVLFGLSVAFYDDGGDGMVGGFLRQTGEPDAEAVLFEADLAVRG